MKLFYWVTRSIVKGVAKLLYGHKVYGVEHIPVGAAILAPNHLSYIDPPLVGISAPEEVAYLARADLFDNPVLGYIIRQLNTYPVGTTGQDLATFKLVSKLLKENKKVVLFPEGARSLDSQLTPFKAGIGMLALRNRCPILPVYIHGSFEVWSRNEKYPKCRGKTACVFGSPIDCSPYEKMPKKEAHEAIAQKVSESIESLRSWYQNSAKGSPP